MQLELYLDAAQQIVDQALDMQEKPEPIRWRFEIDSGDSDANRVRIGGNNAIVNGGNNPVVDGFKKVHHDSWDKKLNVRDFVIKDPGEYIIRFRAASRVPDRAEVVTAEPCIRLLPSTLVAAVPAALTAAVLVALATDDPTPIVINAMTPDVKRAVGRELESVCSIVRSTSARSSPRPRLSRCLAVSSVISRTEATSAIECDSR